jgi:hypothetical protein
METIQGHIQVYSVWVNGRVIEDINQHFPVNCNILNYDNWHNDFKQATKDYFGAKVKDSDDDYGFYSEIYKDYHVALYSININIREFENKFDLKFDIENEEVQEMIPYYVDYDFNVVAERIGKFKK